MFVDDPNLFSFGFTSCSSYHETCLVCDHELYVDDQVMLKSTTATAAPTPTIHTYTPREMADMHIVFFMYTAQFGLQTY